MERRWVSVSGGRFRWVAAARLGDAAVPMRPEATLRRPGHVVAPRGQENQISPVLQGVPGRAAVSWEAYRVRAPTAALPPDDLRDVRTCCTIR